MKPAAPAHHRLTFHWPSRPRVSLTLIGFFFLSALAHIMAFYVFQVLYPTSVTTTPPPAQVTMLAPTPENQALMKWIESEDPSAIANPHEIIPASLHDLPYKPSFEEIRTAPKTVDEKGLAVTFPPAVNPLDMISRSQKPAKEPAAARAEPGTELRFSGPLAGRKINAAPEFKFTPQNTNKPLETASFFVGVDAEGTVQYTVPITSYPDHIGSGDENVNQQAEAHLRRVQFAPSNQNITWGIATYFWGSDAYGKTGK